MQNQEEKQIQKSSAKDEGQNPPAFQASPLNRGASPKIAILHDSFLYRGGGERLVTLMAKSLGADLISGFFSEGSFDPRELGFDGKMISLGKPVFMKGLRHMVLKWRFTQKAKVLSEYDIVIFSGDCLGAVKFLRPDAKKYYYCHTPPRYLFDLRKVYLAKFPAITRPIFSCIFDYFGKIYAKRLEKFDYIWTNSKNVQTRLKHFTGFDSEILYPPVDTGRFAPIPHPPAPSPSEKGSPETPSLLGEGWSEEDYYLSFARLSPPKRVGLIIDAFLKMPENNLIFTYGKNDPLKNEILEKIQSAKNIIGLESPNDEMLIKLIQNATATIYIPIDEDFGMAPVESMACGTPVIGVDEGGLRETIIDGETGRLVGGEMKDEAGSMKHEAGNRKEGGDMRYEIGDMQDLKALIRRPEQSEVVQSWVGGLASELKTIIQTTPKEEWKNMKNACIVQAQNFSLEKFQEKLKSILRD